MIGLAAAARSGGANRLIGKAAVTLADKQHKKEPAAVADPGAGPSLAGAMCPQSTVFGIAASALVPSAAA